MFFSLGISQAAPPTPALQLLHEGDSLFAASRYRRAFQRYDQLWTQYDVYSPQMLLRMSFIQEGLGNYPEALYYLNVYFLRHPDRQTVEKMKSLAEKNKLQGYRFSELDWMLAWYYQYRLWFLAAMLVGAAAMLAATLYYRKRQEGSIYHPLFLLIFLTAAFYLINYGDTYRKGIVSGEKIYLMGAPSAASPVEQVIDRGHRVTVKGVEDVWYEVEWNGQTGYIHRSQLRLIAA
ncbi:SH3 domain-containing protein [Catalinimonas alkaloidigena]|uniref:SH3 domain-containing protein n=1 Tax=Catalinimonas alkaloidigena TaxID=1075417 RepID=UPI0015A29CB1|nr:SH3 domain-containing protein [Catalinimonas alkaloidigena]